MPWLELRITTSPDQANLVEDQLLECGALSVTFEDNADQPIYEPDLGETPLWDQTRLTGLFEAETDTAQIDRQLQLPEKSQKHWQILEDKDWEREWMQHYQPIQCGKNFWICPSWIEPPDPAAVNLLLDPGLAFGTGTHPTTFMCLQWLAEQNLKEKTLIDYGCGSGILAISAYLLGAATITGVDIDPQALLASKENAKRNGIEVEQFPLSLPERAELEPSDYVVANILAGPLVSLAPTLLPLLKSGGRLCLSGILTSQVDAVIEAYSHLIEFDHHAQREEWSCIAGYKK